MKNDYSEERDTTSLNQIIGVQSLNIPRALYTAVEAFPLVLLTLHQSTMASR